MENQLFCTSKTVVIQAGDTSLEKTMLQCLAAAGLPVFINRVVVSFNGTVNSNAPVEMFFEWQTGAGTGGQAVEHVNIATDLRYTATAASPTWLGGIWATTEPTEVSQFGHIYVHPQTWAVIELPFPKEIVVPAAGRLGVCANAPNAVNMNVHAYHYEGR